MNILHIKTIVKLWHWKRNHLSSGKSSFLCQVLSSYMFSGTNHKLYFNWLKRKYASYYRKSRDESRLWVWLIKWTSDVIRDPFLSFSSICHPRYRFHPNACLPHGHEVTGSSHLEQHVLCSYVAKETKTGFSFSEAPSKPLLVSHGAQRT